MCRTSTPLPCWTNKPRPKHVMPTSASVIPLVYLFDRPRHGHPWQQMLTASENDNTVGMAQLTANWRMDHRVSEPLENVLAASGPFPSGATTTIARAVGDYHLHYQCRPVDSIPEPPYRGSANSCNRIDMGRISPAAHLVHIASLNRLLRFALRRSTPGRADLEAYLHGSFGLLPPDPARKTQHETFCDQLARSLTAAGEAAIRELSRNLSEALGPGEPHWWASFSYEIDPYLTGDDWSGAIARTGLGHLEAGEWLLAWRYPAVDAAPLFRPTVIEAVDSGFHFPSPPSHPHGIAMDLSGGQLGVAKVVHAPLKEDDAAEFSLGRIGRVGSAYANIHNHAEMATWFRTTRNRHRKILTATLPADQSWIERHRALP